MAIKKALAFIAALLIVVVEIALVSTVLTFAPSIVHNPDADYLFNQALFYAFWVALVTGVIVLTMGVPAYMALDYRGRSSQKNLALVGAIIPIVILFFILQVTSYEGSGTYSSDQNYYGTYREMVVDNKRTLWGWVSLIEQFVTYSMYGLIGAVTFGKVVSTLRKITK